MVFLYSVGLQPGAFRKRLKTGEARGGGKVNKRQAAMNKVRGLVVKCLKGEGGGGAEMGTRKGYNKIIKGRLDTLTSHLTKNGASRRELILAKQLFRQMQRTLAPPPPPSSLPPFETPPTGKHTPPKSKVPPLKGEEQQKIREKLENGNSKNKRAADREKRKRKRERNRMQHKKQNNPLIGPKPTTQVEGGEYFAKGKEKDVEIARSHVPKHVVQISKQGGGGGDDLEENLDYRRPWEEAEQHEADKLKYKRLKEIRYETAEGTRLGWVDPEEDNDGPQEPKITQNAPRQMLQTVMVEDRSGEVIMTEETKAALMADEIQRKLKGIKKKGKDEDVENMFLGGNVVEDLEELVDDMKKEEHKHRQRQYDASFIRTISNTTSSSEGENPLDMRPFRIKQKEKKKKEREREIRRADRETRRRIEEKAKGRDRKLQDPFSRKETAKLIEDIREEHGADNPNVAEIIDTVRKIEKDLQTPQTIRKASEIRKQSTLITPYVKTDNAGEPPIGPKIPQNDPTLPFLPNIDLGGYGGGGGVPEAGGYFGGKGGNPPGESGGYPGGGYFGGVETELGGILEKEKKAMLKRSKKRGENDAFLPKAVMSGEVGEGIKGEGLEEYQYKMKAKEAKRLFGSSSRLLMDAKDREKLEEKEFEQQQEEKNYFHRDEPELPSHIKDVYEEGGEGPLDRARRKFSEKSKWRIDPDGSRWRSPPTEDKENEGTRITTKKKKNLNFSPRGAPKEDPMEEYRNEYKLEIPHPDNPGIKLENDEDCSSREDSLFAGLSTKGKEKRHSRQDSDRSRDDQDEAIDPAQRILSRSLLGPGVKVTKQGGRLQVIYKTEKGEEKRDLGVPEGGVPEGGVPGRGVPGGGVPGGGVPGQRGPRKIEREDGKNMDILPTQNEQYETVFSDEGEGLPDEEGGGGWEDAEGGGENALLEKKSTEKVGNLKSVREKKGGGTNEKKVKSKRNTKEQDKRNTKEQDQNDEPKGLRDLFEQDKLRLTVKDESLASSDEDPFLSIPKKEKERMRRAFNDTLTHLPPDPSQQLRSRTQEMKSTSESAHWSQSDEEEKEEKVSSGLDSHDTGEIMEWVKHNYPIAKHMFKIDRDRKTKDGIVVNANFSDE
ncbi:hypothetical protein AAMO2058_000293400 [Amorphochlora amoebiformis]